MVAFEKKLLHNFIYTATEKSVAMLDVFYSASWYVTTPNVYYHHF